MENGIIISSTNVPVFKNNSLNESTKKIYALGNKAAKAMYEVAAILAKVQADGTYKDDAFKSAAEYACKTFGFKKSLAYNLIKIGKEYTAENGIESNLPHPDNEDFTATQVSLMLPIGDHDRVFEMCENGELTPGMTAKELREAVKREIGKDEESEESEYADSEESEESEYADSEATPQEKAVAALNTAKAALNTLGRMDEYFNSIISSICQLIKVISEL